MQFSIVVPIFGVEKYLPQCIESILNQSFYDFELILVDDGSRDNCPIICDQYAERDSRIKVIHKENGGIVSARQVGTENAHGEYIVFVDGDDRIGKNYLSIFSDIINEEEVDVIVCGFKKETKKKFTTITPPYEEGYYDPPKIINDIYPSLIHTQDARYFPPSLWAKCFRRMLYRQQQLVDVGLNIGEDFACSIPTVYKARSIYVSYSSEYFYRIDMESMSHAAKVFPFDYPAIIYKHISKKIDMSQADFQEQLYRRCTHDLFDVAVSIFNKKQCYYSSCKDIQKLLRDPLYSEVMENCKFKNLKANLMKYSLRYKLYFAILLYNKYWYHKCFINIFS